MLKLMKNKVLDFLRQMPRFLCQSKINPTIPTRHLVIVIIENHFFLQFADEDSIHYTRVSRSHKRPSNQLN
jgi:hypothetical protein